MSSGLFGQRQGGALPFLHWRARRSARELVSIQGGALAFSRLLSFVYLLCHGLPRGSGVYLLCHGLPRLGQSLWNAPARPGQLSTCLCQVFSGASVDRCRCETGSPMKWMRSLSLRCSLLARYRVERHVKSAIRSCTPQLFLHHVVSSKWRVKESRVR